MNLAPTRLRVWRSIVAWILGIILVAATAFGSLVAYRSYQFPYGWSHCCDKGLALSLISYARDHGGVFPTGGATPEESLSLLYPKYLEAEVLRGKTVPLEKAKRRLDAGLPLTPDTCDWHYVDGLTMQPPSVAHRVAIAWDKVGLGHNGERLPYGGHSVVFMDGGGHVIGADDWQKFIAEQDKAWQSIRAGGQPAAPWVPFWP